MISATTEQLHRSASSVLFWYAAVVVFNHNDIHLGVCAS